MDMITIAENQETHLDVYVSGYPVPRGDQIHWYRPNGVEIQEDEVNIRFNNSRKRLILSNIKLSDAGTYDVEVAVLVTGSFAQMAQTGIDVIVEGKKYAMLYNYARCQTYMPNTHTDNNTHTHTHARMHAYTTHARACTHTHMHTHTQYLLL